MDTPRLLRRVALRALLLVGWAGAPLVATDNAAAQTGGRPWLGIAMDSAASGSGVLVGHVVRTSPADKGGLRAGDRIERVGPVSVARGADVVGALARYSPGDAVQIAFRRSGKAHVARVALASLPSQDDRLRMDLVGAAAPAWNLVDAVSGRFPPSVAALRGHVVLLDFWATWCGPCRMLMPELDALQARLGGQGLDVLGLSTEEGDRVAEFASHVPVHYPIGVDRHAEVTRSYGVMSLPTLVIIDKRGIVRDVDVGYDPGEAQRLESTVRALLAEPGPPG